MTDTARIHRIFAAQQTSRYDIANSSVADRIAKLKALLDLINDSREDIRQAVYADLRKPAAEVDITEFYVVTSEIKHAMRHLRKWMRPRRVRPTMGLATTSSWVQFRPRGVVSIIGPWNYPFLLTLGPIVSAIAAGNCMMVKPSEFSPNTSHLISEMLAKLFPEDEVSVIEGDHTAGAELARLSFDHIFYTGGSNVGKLVMKAAAEHLTPVTLELGGKSPVVVDETADIARAAERIVWGRFVNCGQSCVAPDYVLVQESVASQLVEALKSNIERAFGPSEEARQASPDLARIIDDRHFARIDAMLKKSVEMGAKVEMGGVTDAGERYISPTLLTDVSLESPVMQEEIFGPILPVATFSKLDDALGVIRTLPDPLAAYFFSRKQGNIDKLMANTSSGGACINSVAIQFAHQNLPFGGVRNSGIGTAHGFYGFRAFSHERAVLRQRKIDPLKMLTPPYTKRVKVLVDLIVKYL